MLVSVYLRDQIQSEERAIASDVVARHQRLPQRGEELRPRVKVDPHQQRRDNESGCVPQIALGVVLAGSSRLWGRVARTMTFSAHSRTYCTISGVSLLYCTLRWFFSCSPA